MIARLILAPDLRGRLAAEAAAAFPRECCGLIEGVREFPPPLAGEVPSRAQAGRGAGGCNVDKTRYEVRALDLHPARNMATRPDRFEIDPAAQFALLRRLRGTGREIVGCYHSHPNGAAALSPWDRQGAFEQDFLWLVIAMAPVRSTCLPPGTRPTGSAAPDLSRMLEDQGLIGGLGRHGIVTPRDGRAPSEFRSRSDPPPRCGGRERQRTGGEPASLSAAGSSREPGGGHVRRTNGGIPQSQEDGFRRSARHFEIANGFDVELAAFVFDEEGAREVPLLDCPARPPL